MRSTTSTKGMPLGAVGSDPDGGGGVLDADALAKSGVCFYLFCESSLGIYNEGKR